METYVLENDFLQIAVSSLGAELVSLKKKETEEEYLWNGDEAYWKRHSPVLFPIVGSLKNKEYHYQGKTYPMSQHGFARDNRFQMIHKTKDSIQFLLEASEETKKVYPFDFELQITYTLCKNTLSVGWNVKNREDKTMYFSIGAHPAFLCPIHEGGDKTGYSFLFDSKETLLYSKLTGDGLLKQDTYELETKDGIYPITKEMFDEDALIFENNQAHQISLLKPDKTAYITVTFDAPLFGLWSPAKKNAPFVCIEPWFGRCDSVEFCGTIEEREWGNTLRGKEEFSREYQITVDEL